MYQCEHELKLFLDGVQINQIEILSLHAVSCKNSQFFTKLHVLVIALLEPKISRIFLSDRICKFSWKSKKKIVQILTNFLVHHKNNAKADMNKKLGICSFKISQITLKP